jgi:hypothetical protein
MPNLLWVICNVRSQPKYCVVKQSICTLHGRVGCHVLLQWFEYKFEAAMVQLSAKALEFWALLLGP